MIPSSFKTKIKFYFLLGIAILYYFVCFIVDTNHKAALLLLFSFCSDAISIAYSAAFIDVSEPSIATSIFENFCFLGLYQFII